MLVVAMATASLVFSFGVSWQRLREPPTLTTTTVFDATTSGPWSNSETFGASA